MAAEGAAWQRSAAGMESLRDDWVLWGLLAVVAACLVVALVLLALWNPLFGVLLLACYLPVVGGVIVAGRHRAERRDMVVRMLAVAVEQGMPLSQAFLAMSEQERGRPRVRLAAIARLLEAGAPLPEALALVPGALPVDVATLVGAAWKTGQLARALGESPPAATELKQMRTAVAIRVGYLLTVALAGQVIVGFIMYFVMPKMEAIHMGFGLRLPAVTIALIGASHWLVRFGWPFALLLAIADVPVPIIVPLCIGGWVEGRSLGLDRFFPSRHLAPVLRALAWMVESGQPLPSGIAALFRYHPSGWVRGRLLQVLHEVGAGDDPWDSLRRAGLLRRSDVAVIQSAARVGNLAWAVRETADSAERRAIRRLHAWLHALTVFCLLGAGAVVLLVATSIFVPLVSLLKHITP